MQINKFAGRSFQDVNQYPILPWVLSEYSKDFTNPSVLAKLGGKQNILRNLSYHVSVQTKPKQEYIIDKYIDEKSKGFKRHFGVHYSTSGFLYYYLIRLSPITEDSIKFQNFHFDHPNRIFVSLKDTWEILDRLYDNRELIPDLFSIAEIFLNANCFYMGKNSTTLQLADDFKLPFYAKDNPVYMIYLQRYLLEDKLVSDNICYWIDNIFGENQLKKSKDSLNIFKKCCYGQETNLKEKYKTYKKALNDTSNVIMSTTNVNIQSSSALNSIIPYSPKTGNKSINLGLGLASESNNIKTILFNCYNNSWSSGVSNIGNLGEAEVNVMKKTDKILNFGQVPIKLFDAKHPKKFPKKKFGDFETGFNQFYSDIYYTKKPIRYINYSRNNIYILYFDNEVEVIKTEKLEKNYKFQMKQAANLTCLFYSFSECKQKFAEEQKIFKADKLALEAEIQKITTYLQKLYRDKDHAKMLCDINYRKAFESAEKKYAQRLGLLKNNLKLLLTESNIEAKFPLVYINDYKLHHKYSNVNKNFNASNFAAENAAAMSNSNHAKELNTRINTSWNGSQRGLKKSNKFSHLLYENVLEMIFLNDKNKQSQVFERLSNEKIPISFYKEKYYLVEFCDSKFFIASQYLDRSIKVYSGETNVKEFLLEDVFIILKKIYLFICIIVYL